MLEVCKLNLQAFCHMLLASKVGMWGVGVRFPFKMIHMISRRTPKGSQTVHL